MTTIKTFCQFCDCYCGDISIFDAPYTGEPICHDCSGENDWLSIDTPIMSILGVC